MAKYELANEADYYGIDALVWAIRQPPIDLEEYLPSKVLAIQQNETKLRHSFVAGSREGGDSATSAHQFPRQSWNYQGLISLFTKGSDDETGVTSCPTCPLTFQPDHELRKDSQRLFLSAVHQDDTNNPVTDRTPVSVSCLNDFISNFNQEDPNILHRLGPVLRGGNVIVAGGSVLRALTANEGIRTGGGWWIPTVPPPFESAFNLKSDIDLFIHGVCKIEADDLVSQVFSALAEDNESWMVARTRGVINMHNRSTSCKVQIVLRIYDSISEVLIGFDVDCCCCCYDGERVWVTPRWIAALQSGVNVLNPLHAWPKKASYELRLGKYAFRGFEVYVPGLDIKRVDRDRIQKLHLEDLCGLARLLKVFFEMQGSTPYAVLAMAENDDLVLDYRPRTPGEIENLRNEVVDNMTPDEGLLANLEPLYPSEGGSVLIPRVYLPTILDEDSHVRDNYSYLDFDPKAASETRDEAIEVIVNCTINQRSTENVPRKLFDSWITEKVSREYLNDIMDKIDVDTIYYAAAYIEEA